MSLVVVRKYKRYSRTVNNILDSLGAGEILEKQERIVIKPNLTTNRGPPTTTDVRCVEAIVRYCKSTSAKIIIAEGSGGCDTFKCYEELGYMDLERYGVKIVDLNNEPVREWRKKSAYKLKKIYIPKILENSYLISVPVLKEHNWTRVSISLKNMIGILPGRFYNRKTTWNKAMLHTLGLDECIVDINTCIKPDLTVVDARLGQVGSEVNGRVPDKPFNMLMGGYDPVAVDWKGAEFLHHDPYKVEYLRLAPEKGIGIRDPSEIEVDSDVEDPFRKNRSAADRFRSYVFRKVGKNLVRVVGKEGNL